jgi:hypothetical protein
MKVGQARRKTVKKTNCNLDQLVSSFNVWTTLTVRLSRLERFTRGDKYNTHFIQFGRTSKHLQNW